MIPSQDPFPPNAQFYVRRDRIFGRDLMVTMYCKHPDGFAVAPPVVLAIHQETAVSPPPTMVINTAAAQNLMDELWGAGLRPSEGSGSAGAFAAVQHHLSDMRDLVQHLAEMQFKTKDHGNPPKTPRS